jgi:hypothetical protein
MPVMHAEKSFAKEKSHLGNKYFHQYNMVSFKIIFQFLIIFYTDMQIILKYTIEMM